MKVYNVILHLDPSRWMPEGQIASFLQHVFNFNPETSSKIAKDVWEFGKAIIRTADIETAEYYLEKLTQNGVLSDGTRFGYNASIEPVR